MKKILITGENSYIGNNFKEWLSQWSDKYHVDKVNTRDGVWEQTDFSSYDSILHVAGIAHIKETKENQALYYQVNRDLAVNIARKAKREEVKQFILLSSMSVYGLNTGEIDETTPLAPKSVYGKSKLAAEEMINELQDKHFKLAIIRPPMVYGKNSKGNYAKLSKFAKISPVFPAIENKRSMIYIDNLSEFTRNLINNENVGIFHPQNKEFINTSEMVYTISKINNKKIWMTKLFNPILQMLSDIKIIDKVFGNLVYKLEISDMDFAYRVYDFSESIKLTESRL